MRLPKLLPLALLAVPFVCLALRGADDDKKGKKSEPLSVTDNNDKKHKVTDWKWLSGTRRVAWLADDKDKDGPEVFVLREGEKIHNVAGVDTLIPLDRLRSVSVDTDKKVLVVKAVGDKDEEVSMTGSVKYKGFNLVAVEGDVDRGDQGVVSVRYQGGAILKGNLKAIDFPAKKVTAIRGSRPAVVKTDDDGVKATHKVSDLMPLYKVGTAQKTSPLLFFKKTLKLDVSKIQSIEAVDGGKDISWKVKQRGAEEEDALILIQQTKIDDKDATLVGFVAKVPVGYKLIPVRRVASILFDQAEDVPDNQLPPPLVEKVEK